MHVVTIRRARRGWEYTVYAAHPTRVAMNVAVVFGCDDPAVLAIALLHDTIEDCSTDYEDLAGAFGDEVAKGINEALESFDEIPKPVVVRLAGTNAEEGMEILNTDLVQVEGTLEDAVQRAVENAQEVSQ